MKSPVVCIMGPTAAGKTDLAIALCQRLPCEIISVDSAMIYREMNIGTSKPSEEIQQTIPHHLIDIRDPSQSYSAAEFCHDAELAITAIQQRGKIPLLVGGTMLYFKSFQQGLSLLPSSNVEVRKSLQKMLEKQGLNYLYEKLQEIDPKSAGRINANDPQRILRALEVHELTGKTLSDMWNDSKGIRSTHQFINIAIAPSERHVLHERIAKRFLQMIEQGFIDEVKMLYQRGDLNLSLPSMRAVGYRQIWEYLAQCVAGTADLADNLLYQQMIERGIIATRQLAKRQLTWLRSWPELHWITSDGDAQLQEALSLIN